VTEASGPLERITAERERLGRGLGSPWAGPGESDSLPLVMSETKRLAKALCDPAKIDDDGFLPESLRARFAEAGLFGLTIPEAHGGSGFSLKAACAVIAEIASVERSSAIMVGLHSGLGSRPLVELGSEDLSTRYLPEMAAGNRIAAFAATEAEAGSDLSSIRTTGTLTDAGLRLDGEKVYVTNGGFARVFTVLARTPGLGGARAHSLVLVPAETPGVSIGPEEDKLGIRGSSTITLGLEGVVVPRANILGEAGKGIEQAHAALAWGRTLMAAGCVGTARAALDATLGHVTTRRQFGRAIGEFPASRAHVARMAARVYAMETVVRWVGETLAANEAVDELSATAKVLCSEGAFDVCDQAVQLHGALGFIEPVGVARMLRDCRITRIFEGANDVLLVRLGTAVVARRAPTVTELLAPQVHEPRLHEAAKAWDATRDRFLAAVQDVRRSHGVSVVRRQLVLQTVARANIALQAAGASILRAENARDEAERALGCHAAEEFVIEAERHLVELPRAVDDESRAERVTEYLYAPWLAAQAPSQEKKS
jgi:alkylation response protein AidB-like acyl-CoA dehydrogenase